MVELFRTEYDERSGTMINNYIPVLSCSGEKIKDWFSYSDEQHIMFVASPEAVLNAPPPKFPLGIKYCRPDDKIFDTEDTWLDLVKKQNHPDLIPAYQLYKRDIYHKFYMKYRNNFYIISAGWGIIRASYKIPAYNITYSNSKSVPKYSRRINSDKWNDFNHLKEDSANFDENSIIILFSGSNYIESFCNMTKFIKNRKIIYYTAQSISKKDGFEYSKYKKNFTNWHYEAAKEYL